MSRIQADAVQSIQRMRHANMVGHANPPPNIVPQANNDPGSNVDHNEDDDESSDYCSRGLEAMATPAAAAAHRAAQAAVRDAVLDDQDRQSLADICDEERIAVASSAASSSAFSSPSRALL